MDRSVRGASLVWAATLFLLGCAHAPGGHSVQSPAVVALPAAWAVQPCVVIDSSVPTADTLLVAPGRLADPNVPKSSFTCGALRAAAFVDTPFVMRLDASEERDPRELLEDTIQVGGAAHRVDVLITRDPVVLAYAASTGRYLVAAMPWTVTYVVVPGRANSSGALPTVGERNALARDAVSIDARGAAEPFSWRSDSACAYSPAVPVAPPSPVIAYAAGDTTARRLAERIVALVGAKNADQWFTAILEAGSTAAQWQIAAVRTDSLQAALASGTATAAVEGVERDPGLSCGMADFVRIPVGAVPLIDVRAHVIVRRGSGAAFIIGADGSLHFFRRNTR